MEKLKRWHLILIVTVIFLTIYNVLPTVIYYSKPLSKPIEEKQALQIGSQALSRITELEKDSIDWLNSFSKNLDIKPKSIELVENSPQLIELTFQRPEDAKKFKTFLPRAGALISFVPAQLSIASDANDSPNKVLVERKINFSPKEDNIAKYMRYVPKRDKGEVSNEYKNIILDRFSELAKGFAGETQNSQLLSTLSENPPIATVENELLDAAQNIHSIANILGEKSPIAKRLFKSYSQMASKPQKGITPLLDSFEKLAQTFEQKASSSKEDSESASRYKKDAELLKNSAVIVKRNHKVFEEGLPPLTDEALKENLIDSKLSIASLNPFIETLSINWEKEIIEIALHTDIEEINASLVNTASLKHKKEKINQLIINEIARVSQITDDAIAPSRFGYQIALNELFDSNSMLVFDLSNIATQEVSRLKDKVENQWNPQSPEFKDHAFPIWDYETYLSLSPSEKKFGLLIYAPVIDAKKPLYGFRNNSVYVIAKGLTPILQKYQQYSNLEQAETFKEEFMELQNIFRQQGFELSYLASGPGYAKEVQNEFVFENPNYYADILAATRENFKVKGSKRFATLELTNLEQRLVALNKIEGEMHEELLKWKDDYNASLVDLQDSQSKLFMPPPTKNVYLNNFKLNFKEYFRGDHRKVLKWGLDLSGGKSILIGLRDHHNKPITDKAELTEGANELTQRVNKMGLSEVDIRVEGNNIALDFPSSKGLSASELIKGSTMSFHVVNEKFASKNSPHYQHMQKFLQDVWNEAVITNRKDIESINAITWKHLGGTEDGLTIQPRNEHAKEIYENGFTISSPTEQRSDFDIKSTLSSIGVYRGKDYTEWRGQTHPLIPIFNNYALEGADIENVRTGYDPSQGNVLSFNVKSSSKNAEKNNPRDILSTWTSIYAKEKIVGTANERYTPSRGWRLAIVLNGQVINDPLLNQPLRDNIQVSGGFTQHEVSKLASDLKAGSLSFTPHILSEENVSADLGQAERFQGIMATAIALLLVILLMVSYYRFSGIIASIAVLFNLLIMWGTLQNLGATLTLSGIAGIILTVGMAVDANVLVFERIREELKHTERLSVAIMTGYKKAFSAIFDSNITTIIAAVILLNFDAGPIKGLAITLTIGIASSMFTALFMTRAFFIKWLSFTKAKTLHMASWFKVHAFSFLKHARWISTLSMCLILIGGTLLFQQRGSIIGMDFTGGYSLSMQLEKTGSQNYRKEVSDALVQAGLKSSEFQLRELNIANSLRVQLSSSLEEIGRPFHGMPIELTEKSVDYPWQKNPRLSWVVDALKTSHLKLTDKSLKTLDKNWSEMSGQLSKTTRNNALLGLFIAMLFILIYISFRYEVKYAMSAILCLLHDVLITLAFIAILHFAGVTIQINMQIIAALMTIIGYSLNDTIIVFDRIREEKKLLKKLSFREVIDHSISVTLNRTLMTSLTTFVVLLALVVLGGSKIFDFSFVMSIGVILGTLSSLFIAPLLLHYFHKEEKEREKPFTPISVNDNTTA